MKNSMKELKSYTKIFDKREYAMNPRRCLILVEDTFHQKYPKLDFSTSITPSGSWIRISVVETKKDLMSYDEPREERSDPSGDSQE
jgi:hypothetical protein